MARVMQHVLRWIQYIAVTILCAALVTTASDPDLARRAWDFLEPRLDLVVARIIPAAVAGVLLISQALLVVRWLRERRYARDIGYNNEYGRVSVSLVAIEEALTRAMENEPGVRRVAIRVYEDRVKRQVIIDTAVTLWETNDVTSINHRCQDLLRNRFAELMPEKTAVQVHLNLHRLDRRRAETTPPPATATAEGSTVTADPVGEAEDDAADEGAEPARPGPETSLALALERSEDELDEEDLYTGPTYPVEDDDDINEGPVDPQPARPV